MLDSVSSSSHGEPYEARAFIAGEWVSKPIARSLREPFQNAVVSRVHDCDQADLERALATLAGAPVAAIASMERSACLHRAAALMKERSELIATVLTRETGKTIRDSRQELARATDVLRFCAEEAIRIEGRQLPIAGSPAGNAKVAIGLRYPVGVIAGIVPFNAPVNLACHKIGPAFAAGNAIAVKAPPQAPCTLSLVVQVCLDAGFPPDAIALLHGDGDLGAALVRDSRVDFISFTGSARAGLAIKAAAGMRGTILELGGVGPTIIHHDANIAEAAAMCAQAGYRLAGQSCASLQNLFVHQALLERFTALFLEKVAGLTYGDPRDSATDVGPVINETAAVRIESWLAEARAGGARILVGGGRRGNVIEPTVVSAASPQMKIVCDEVFGPVVVIHPYDDIGAVLEWIRGTGLGLNCGLFTELHSVAFRVAREAPCAAIIVNGTSTFRPDQIPYGGLRNSGYGRESPRDTIIAMTQERILVFPDVI